VSKRVVYEIVKEEFCVAAICCNDVPFPIFDANGQVLLELMHSTHFFRMLEASQNTGLEERQDAVLAGRKVPS